MVDDLVEMEFGAWEGLTLAAAHEQWSTRFREWAASNPDRAALLERLAEGRLPDGWEAGLPSFDADPKGMATRKASGSAIQALAAAMSGNWMRTTPSAAGPSSVSVAPYAANTSMPSIRASTAAAR